MEKKSKPEKNEHPYAKANIFSIISFWWMTSLFVKGYKHGLVSEDIYEALPQHKSAYLSAKVESYFYDPKSKGKKNKLIKSLLKVFYPKMIVNGVILVIFESIKVVQPILVGELVSYFDDQTSMSSSTAYLYGGLLAATACINWMPGANFFFLNQVLGLQARAACSSLIYKKSLKLGNTSLNQISSGRIVNLMSTDIEKFNFGTMFYHYGWLSPLEGAVVMYLLYREVSWSFLPAVIFLLLMGPLQAVLARVFSRLRYQIAGLTDKRIHVMSELIGAMRVIKMYCWEKPFGNLVSQLRRAEMKYIWRSNTVKGQNETMSFISPKIATFCIMLTFYYTGGTIRANTVIKVLSWTELLKGGVLWMLSLCVQYTMELLASVNRMESFLDTEEMEEDINNDQKNANKEKKIDGEDSIIKLNNLSASWEDPTTSKDTNGDTLKNLNLNIKLGELVAVIGDVGAGKSSLLMALLGEIVPTSGSRHVEGQIAYVPQESWVFSGTVRDNILFGNEHDNDMYHNTVNACSLQKDFELLDNNDMTLVGEKGYSLSGGQKARINLARAAYREADIYLMDDPLSAVDTKVARHLFEKCICGKMKGKTRVLVTHQVQFLRRADQIVVMKNGAFLAKGTYEEVSKYVNIASVVATDKEKEKEGEHQIMRDLNRSSSRIRYRRQSSMETTVSSIPGEEIDLEILDDANEYKPVQEEDNAGGAVSLKVYASYFGAGKGIILFPFFLFFALGAQVTSNLSDYILTNWENWNTPDTAMYVYIGLFVGLFSLGTLRAVTFFSMTTKASQNLHDQLFSALLRAPISFFDKNPTGRILNRFSRDIGFMDDILPQTFHQVTMYLASFLGTIIFVSISNYWTIILTVPVMIVIVLIRQFAMNASRDIKRIESTARSPVYSHLSATLIGLPIIRAFKVQDSFIDVFYKYQDHQTSSWMLYIASHRWFGVRLDWCIAFYFSGCILAAFLTSSAEGGAIGLSLSYIIGMLGFVQFIMRQSAEAESYMTSVERVLEYARIEPEASEHNDSYRPPKNWPSTGKLEFKDMCLSYAEDAPNVLKNIDLTIEDGESIGIVGRTGAGKSSLISCLLRLNEPSGSIKIDDMEATKLGLADLRGSLSIIPQDPVLFSGTFRYNLDPLSEYSDEQLWNALAQVQLSEKVNSMEGGLYGEMSEAGGNLSVGQRQLVCLARAILRNKKILLIDEATANVDPKTDDLIQKALRQNFTNCTVLCIAHRLNTIIDSDRVLVLDQGTVVEFDHAHTLLQRRQGFLYEMVKQTGPQTEKRLHSLAKAAFINKMTGGQGQPAYHTSRTRVDSGREMITEVSEPNFQSVIQKYEQLNDGEGIYEQVNDGDGIYEQLNEEKNNSEQLGHEKMTYTNLAFQQDLEMTRL